MIVMKFGGSSIAAAERIRETVGIVKSNLDKKPIVVVSAFGGVTDNLIELSHLSLKGKGKGLLQDIKNRHASIAKELKIDQGIVDRELAALKKLLLGVELLGELTPKTSDVIVSFGERMSSKIIAQYMVSQGIDAKACNAYELNLVTDSNFGNADVLESTYGMLKKSLSKVDGVPVVTGYIGRDRNGNITTLGRGGSDYTASIIGAAIGAKEIQIWTDVDGIMTTDPRIVKSAKSIECVSYDEASELAFLGAKVLHPKTILPAINKNIPVRILNTFNSGHRGTLVLKDIKARSRIAAIACKKKVQVVNIHTPRMFQTRGFLRKTFEIFDELGFSVDMVSTSEINVSVTIDGKADTEKLVKELKRLGEVKVMAKRAKISLVGKNMAMKPGIFAKLSASLGSIEIEMISSSTSEINQSFVVREEDADEAVRRLHRTFFGA